MGGLSQEVSLGYGYSGSSAESEGGINSSSSQHQFGENYSMGFRYAIYDPRLLGGNFTGSVGLTQSQASTREGTDSGQTFQYRLNSTLLRDSSSPVSFHSYSQLTKVQRPFAPTYDLTTGGLAASLSIHNQFIPSSISYNRNTAASSGQGVDTSSTTDSLSLSASHKYRNLVQTSASFSRSNTETDSGGIGVNFSMEQMQVGLSNNISFNAELARTLLSRYMLRESTGFRELRTSEWTENLSWGFGRGLHGSLGYSNIYQNSDGQQVTTNNIGAMLQHRLFQSLTTQLQGHGSKADFSSGSTTNVGGGFSLNYLKTLPRDSSLQLGLSQSYSVTENDFRADELFVLNETHTVPDLVALFEIQLVTPDIVHDRPEDIEVRNIAQPAEVYTEGTDYTVRREGRLTFIVFPLTPPARLFPLAPGTAIAIDYRHLVDPSIRFSTTSLAATGSLSLFGNRHRIYASYAESSQESLSGQESVARLFSSRTYVAGFATKREYVSYGGTFARNESNITDSNTLAGFWRYARTFDTYYLSAGVRDSFSMLGNSAAAAGSDYSNSFSMDGVLQKILLGWINMNLNGQYLNTIGGTDSNRLAFGLGLNAWFGRSKVTLQSTVAWLFTRTTTERQDQVQLSLSRYF